MASTQTIAQTYAGKNIFITGGTGFIGKVLTEKLLRSCKDVGNIYWLSRPKKGLNSEARLVKTLENPLFDLLREENPEAFKKIKLVSGDVQQLNLGLSDEDYEEIINNVSIVFHVAATIKFNEDLKDAILLNVRGTREICNLVLKLKNITAFVHVSTVYCQHQNKIIEERTYHFNVNWKEVIEVAENFDRNTLNVLTAKYIGNNPNTYIFSKALAEKVVEETCANKVPLIIFRPAIVVSTYDDPITGWTDNLNGPFGIWMGFARGIIKSSIYKRKAKQEIIPVDYLVKGMISSVWKQRNAIEIAVYNGFYRSIYTTEIEEFGVANFHKLKIPNSFLPAKHDIEGFHWFLINFYLWQLLPAFLIDIVAKISGKKPILMKIQKKIFTTMIILYYFLVGSWEIKNAKFLDILENIPKEDFKTFGVVSNERNEIINRKYMVDSMHFIHQHLLKGKLMDKQIGKKKLSMMIIYNRIKYFSLRLFLTICIAYACFYLLI